MKKRLIVTAAALAVLCWAGAASAADMNGSFCRNVGGAVGDIITLTPKGAVSIVELKEGWDKPVYSAGVGSAVGNTFTATLKSKNVADHRPCRDEGIGQQPVVRFLQPGRDVPLERRLQPLLPLTDVF